MSTAPQCSVNGGEALTYSPIIIIYAIMLLTSTCLFGAYTNSDLNGLAWLWGSVL